MLDMNTNKDNSFDRQDANNSLGKQVADDILGRLEACPPSVSPSVPPNVPLGAPPATFFDNPYYDKDEAMMVSVGHLPHVSERQKLYVVTFRLHDSLPREVVKGYLEECKRMFGGDMPAFKTKRESLLYQKMMEAMDAGYGECLLKDKAIRRIVEDAFDFVDDNMAGVDAYVIMPNHVHVVLRTYEGITIQQVIHSVKSYTAVEINRQLHRSGGVWQREYYDRIIRNEAHYANAINYIRSNPRHCKSGEYTLWLGE